MKTILLICVLLFTSFFVKAQNCPSAIVQGNVVTSPVGLTSVTTSNIANFGDNSLATSATGFFGLDGTLALTLTSPTYLNNSTVGVVISSASFNGSLLQEMQNVAKIELYYDTNLVQTFAGTNILDVTPTLLPNQTSKLVIGGVATDNFNKVRIIYGGFWAGGILSSLDVYGVLVPSNPQAGTLSN